MSEHSSKQVVIHHAQFLRRYLLRQGCEFARTPDEIGIFDAIVFLESLSDESDVLPAGDGWVDNAKYLLEQCPFAIRVREGGGPEDLLSSLIITFQGMQARLARKI